MMRARTSDTWSERLEQVGFDFADGLCSYEAAVERLQRECDFSWDEAISHLDCFTPPEEA